MTSNRVILILLSIIVVGSILRVYHVDTESVWLDEAASIAGSKEKVVSVIQSSGKMHNQPPLYFILLHYWMRFFGTSELAVRSLSAIFGIVSIFVIYQVGFQLFNWKVGLISSFLSAISCYHIYYSQEARVYSLLHLLTLLSFFVFIRSLRGNGKRALNFALLLLVNVCLAYAHPYGIFVIISQNAYFLLLWSECRGLRWWFFGVQIATVTLFLPWIPTFIDRVSHVSQGFWIPRPTLKSILYTVKDYAGGDDGLSWISFFLFSIFCAIGLISVKRLEGGWIWRKPLQGIKKLSLNISPEYVEESLLLLMWFAFPIVVPFVVSQVATPMYLSRYTISASPAFYLLVAKGISSFTSRMALFCLIIIIFLLSLPGLQNYYTQTKKDQWRETTRFVEHNGRAKDVIIIWPDFSHLPFDYYYTGNLEKFGIGPSDAQDTNKIVGVIDRAIVGKERLWLILDDPGVTSNSIKDVLVSRFGGRSAMNEKKGFRGIDVYLFNVSPESQ